MTEQATWTPAADLIPEPLRPYLDRFERLNPLQSTAVPRILDTDGHVMVVAPTSSGKTLIGEVAALRAIVADGRPAVWLLPARALAGEVADTAKRWRAHGIRTVELTGETNMSSDSVRRAQLWVATTEKFEALYRRASLRDVIERIGCLIIDEVHLVGDPARGATLESLIARLRAADGPTRIVALSATVANADELADWFGAELVTSTWRPTSLTTRLVTYKVPDGSREKHEEAKDAVIVPLLRRILGPIDEPDAAAGSAVVFCGSKRAVLRTAAKAAGIPFRGDEDPERLVDACYLRGVGIHFRDAPHARRALDAFRARTLRLLVATSGLSTGVNTPAKHVVIRDLELGMTPLEVSQAQQMLGRAGRAGHETEGFGYMLVPRTEEADWQSRLHLGYAARSRLATQLADAILAEMVLGSVTDRASAASWFAHTLAHAQRGPGAGTDAAVDTLVRGGFATEADGSLAPTEIGALTSRLMIDVASAARLLRSLAGLPIPTTATEAEEVLVQTVASSVAALRERPVNERTYGEYVDRMLRSWSSRALAPAKGEFGVRVCMAAAHIALREPGRDRERMPAGVSNAEFRRVIDEMPRYLAWVAALGCTGSSRTEPRGGGGVGSGSGATATWAPAVAGDLTRRMTWWWLRPHPERGTGRLLWMLERMLEPQNRRARMPDLWKRARDAGFATPDTINAPPRGVDIARTEFDDLVAGRADFALGDVSDGVLTYSTDNRGARVAAMTSTGEAQAVAGIRPAEGALTLTLPRGASGRFAVEAFLFTREGDVGYAHLMAETADAATPDVSPLEEAWALVRGLPDDPGAGVSNGAAAGHGARRVRRETVAPLIECDPRLAGVASALAEHRGEPEAAVLALGTHLRELLRTSARPGLRAPIAVLRSREASEDEVQVTLAALAAALGIESAVAYADARLVAAVHANGRWRLAAPRHTRYTRVRPLVPATLPDALESLAAPTRRGPVRPAEPQMPWAAEFTGGPRD